MNDGLPRASTTNDAPEASSLARWSDPRSLLLVALGSAALFHSLAFAYGVVSDDEAIHAAEARIVVGGGVIYRDFAEHRPPGLPATYASLFALVGDAYARGISAVHGLGVLVAMMTALVVWEIGRIVTDRRTAAVGALVYALCSVAKVPYDGIAVNGELLMNLPTAVAVWAALARPVASMDPRGVALDVVVGIMGALASLYKYQAGLVLAALIVVALERPRSAPLRLASWGLGFLVPFLGFAFYFSSHDALSEARFWGLEFNRNYLKEGPPLLWSLKRLGAQLLGVVLPAALLYGGGLLTLSRILRRRPEATSELPAHRAFFGTWALLSLAAVGLGGRFFGHYFLQAELPLALLAAAPAARLLDRSPRSFWALALAPAVCFGLGSVLPLGEPGKWLDSDQPDYAAIGRAIREDTLPGDSIWVWGNVPQLYFTSQRRPGVRFTFCNYLTGLSPATPSEYDPANDPSKNALPSAWPLVVHDLDQNRPRLIVDTAEAGLKSYSKFPISKYPVLSAYLSAHYVRDGAAAGVPLYRRID